MRNNCKYHSISNASLFYPTEKKVSLYIILGGLFGLSLLIIFALVFFVFSSNTTSQAVRDARALQRYIGSEIQILEIHVINDISQLIAIDYRRGTLIEFRGIRGRDSALVTRSRVIVMSKATENSTNNALTPIQRRDAAQDAVVISQLILSIHSAKAQQLIEVAINAPNPTAAAIAIENLGLFDDGNIVEVDAEHVQNRMR